MYGFFQSWQACNFHHQQFEKAEGMTPYGASLDIKTWHE
jgi:hypothetical protein